MPIYTQAANARDILRTIYALAESHPVNITPESKPRQIADYLHRQGLVRQSGGIILWRPLAFGAWQKVETLPKLAAVVEFLTDRTLTLEQADQVSAHLSVIADVRAHLDALTHCARAQEESLE